MTQERTLPLTAHPNIAWLMQKACDALDQGRMADASRYLRLAAHLTKCESVIGIVRSREVD